MSILEKIDSVAKGAKTYLAAGTGVMIVAALQSQGVDAEGFIDTIQGLATDAVTVVVTIQALIISTFRKAMPDAR